MTANEILAQIVAMTDEQKNLFVQSLYSSEIGKKVFAIMKGLSVEQEPAPDPVETTNQEFIIRFAPEAVILESFNSFLVPKLTMVDTSHLNMLLYEVDQNEEILTELLIQSSEEITISGETFVLITLENDSLSNYLDFGLNNFILYYNFPPDINISYKLRIYV